MKDSQQPFRGILKADEVQADAESRRFGRRFEEFVSLPENPQRVARREIVAMMIHALHVARIDSCVTCGNGRTKGVVSRLGDLPRTHDRASRRRNWLPCGIYSRERATTQLGAADQ